VCLGNRYRSANLWSVDVAGRWGPRLVRGNAKCLVEPRHQDILRACNLQAILNECIEAVDPEIAWKGSICTEREKAESERRLTLAKRALLCLCTAFVQGNQENQGLLFGSLEALEGIATPPALRVEDSSEGAGLDSRRTQRQQAAAAATVTATVTTAAAAAKSVGLMADGRTSDEEDDDVATSLGAQSPLKSPHATPPPSVSNSFTATSSPAASEPWPCSLFELAQNLILDLLRGNARLCVQVRTTTGATLQAVVLRIITLVRVSPHDDVV